MTLIAISQSFAGTYQGKISDRLELRLYCDRDWTDSLGVRHYPGTVNSQTFYAKVACTINPSTRIITIPSFTTQSTDDALDGADVRLTAGIYVARGGRRISFHLEDFVIPAIGAATNWNDLRFYNAPSLPPSALPDSVITDIFDQLANLSLAPDASDVEKGKGRVSPAPDDPNDPEFVGTNHPAFRSQLQLDYLAIGATLPAGIAGISGLRELIIDRLAVVADDTILVPDLFVSFRGRNPNLQVASGKTLEIGAMADPGNRHIFSGAGRKIFSKNAVEEFNLAWYLPSDLPAPGGIGGFTDYVTDALDDLIDSAVNNSGGTIKLPAKILPLSGDTFAFPDGATLKGRGTSFYRTTDYGTVFQPVAVDKAIFTAGGLQSNVRFEDFTIDGTLSPAGIGIQFKGSYPDSSFGFGAQRVRITNLLEGISIIAADNDRAWECEGMLFEGVQITGCQTAVRSNIINGSQTWIAPHVDVPLLGTAFKFEQAGLTNIIGANLASTSLDGDKCFHVTGGHIELNITGAQAEGIRAFLVVDVPYLAHPINIKGSLIQGVIELNYSCVLVLENCNIFAECVFDRNADDAVSEVYLMGGTEFRRHNDNVYLAYTTLVVGAIRESVSADESPAPQIITIDKTTDLLTVPANFAETGTRMRFRAGAGGILPPEAVTGIDYWFIKVTSTTGYLADSLNSAANDVHIDFTDNSIGTTYAELAPARIDKFVGTSRVHKLGRNINIGGNLEADGFLRVGGATGGRDLGTRISNAAPSVSDFPQASDRGVHFNSITGVTKYCVNINGTIKTTTLS